MTRTNLFDDHVPLMRPWLDGDELAEVAAVLSSGWVSLGPKVAEFEHAVASLVGAGHAVATNAATTALHLALHVHDLEPGSEVILPSFTCMANANAVLMAGARCRFADIDPATYNLDPADVAARIGPRTGAIMVVDQIGQPADLPAFQALAARHGLALVDDAATAFGARAHGRHLGGHGTPTCFSFHPRKVITTGEGGMLVTDDEELAARARRLRSTGASISDLDRHRSRGALFQRYDEPGFNYRLTDIQAAVGVAQMRKLPAILAERRAIAERYTAMIDERLHGLVTPPAVPAWAEPAWSSYCVRVTAECPHRPDDLVRAMAAAGISCRRGIQPLHHEPCFADQQDLVLPATEQVAAETLFLPIFPGLHEADQTRVVDALVTIASSGQ